MLQHVASLLPRFFNYRRSIKTHIIWKAVALVVVIILLHHFVHQWNEGSILYRRMMHEFEDPFSGYLNDTSYDEFLVKSPIIDGIYQSNERSNLQLIIFAVANKMTQPGCDTLRVNSLLNHSINFLGLKHRAFTKHASHLYKITTMYHQLKYLFESDHFNNDHTIILGVDAFDVLIQSSPNEILSRYTQTINDEDELDDPYFGFTSNTVIFSGESNCYPCDENMKSQYESEWYLNAGSWISSIRTQFKLFEKILEFEVEFKKDSTKKELQNSDQYVFHQLYLDQDAQSDYKIIIDESSSLFRTTYHIDSSMRSHLLRDFNNDGDGGGDDKGKDYGYAAMVHFNSPQEHREMDHVVEKIKSDLGDAFFENDYELMINSNLGLMSLHSFCFM